MVIVNSAFGELWWMLAAALRDTFWPVFLCLFALWLIRPWGANLQAGLRRRYLAVFVVANLAQLHIAILAAGWPYGWRGGGSGFLHLADWPRWLPLLGIAMFASTRVFGAGAAYRRAMLLLPQAVGQCPDCGYPGIHERCPECGATRTPVKPQRPWTAIGLGLTICGSAILGPEIVRLAVVERGRPSILASFLLLLLLVLAIIGAIREIRRGAEADDGARPTAT